MSANPLAFSVVVASSCPSAGGDCDWVELRRDQDFFLLAHDLEQMAVDADLLFENRDQRLAEKFYIFPHLNNPA